MSESPKKPFLTRGRIIRWVVYLVLLVIVMTQFQGFGCSRIGSDAARSMSPILLQGKSYMVIEEPAEKLMRDAIVLWFTRDPEGKALPHYSRVQGIPGDQIKRIGETWAFEDAAQELHYLPRDLESTAIEALKDQRIGDGKYYLLNHNRKVDLPDSRTLGLIERRWIRARILPSVFGGER